MTRRSTVWLVVAVLFVLANLAGATYAAVRGELVHTGGHLGLLLVGAYVAWRLAPTRYGRAIWSRKRSAAPAVPPELTDRLTNLEQSVDAVAIEVERIGEGQRFMTRLFTENDPAPARAEGDAEPIETKAPELAPDARQS